MKSKDQQSPLERELSLVGGRIKKTQTAFAAVQANLQAGDISAVFESTFALSEASEKLTLSCRRYITQSNSRPVRLR